MLATKIKYITSSPDIIILPEMFTTGFSMRPELFAEAPNAETTYWMQMQAKVTGSVICGSVMMKDGGKYYNRFIWMQPDGICFTYDKKHLFRMGEENNHYSFGTTQLKLSYKGWNIVPMICYDLRFPVWCCHPEANLILFVANWPERRKEHWIKLIEARAIENQCYVAGVNRVGQDGNGIYYSGNSLVVDPKGARVAYSAHDECLIEAKLSFEEMSIYRSQFPAWKDADSFGLKGG
jgi:predicted amidohydrolase